MIKLDQPNIAELPELRHIGKPLPRIDAMGKVTGITKYAGDYSMPNMLHARVLRSKYPSAKIVRVDASNARALAGVAPIGGVSPVSLPGFFNAGDGKKR